jgi:predicted Zn-dependent protease
VAPRSPGPRRDISAELSNAQARIDEQDWLGAVDALKKARAKDPGNINVLNLLGHAQRRAGDLDGAILSFQTLLRQQPAHRSAREQLGKALLLMGRPDEAQQQLEELQRQCGDCVEARELDHVIRGNLQR